MATKGPIDQKQLLNSLDKIDLTSERISKIVKGLLAFSRQGETEEASHNNLLSLFNSTIEFAAQKLKNIGVTCELEMDPGLIIECRAIQVSQVLLNLLTNACDAIEEQKQPWIKVSAHKMGEDVLIAVTDSGGGIDKEKADRLFEPFSTTKPIGKGTGLGLSIALGLVHSHHGTLTIDHSCVNTKFDIRLPQFQPIKKLLGIDKAA